MLKLNNKIYNKGFFIVFEGIDGVGKTTQINNLAISLKEDYEVVILKEPSNTICGNKIREIAKKGRIDNFDPLIELDYFIKDREIDVKKNIIPNLNKNKIILMDRYILSNFAYQSVLNIEKQKILDLNKNFPWPNLTLILELPVEKSLKRILENRNEIPNAGYEKEDFLKKVNENFKKLNFPNLKYLNADMSEQELAEEIKIIVKGYLEKNNLNE